MKFTAFNQEKVWWLTWITIFAAFITSTIVLYRFVSLSQKSNETLLLTSSKENIIINAVAAEGNLEPEGEVINLFPPASLVGVNSRIEQLFVKQGQIVKIGQIVAIMDSYPRLFAAFKKAQTEVLVAQANLGKIKAGAKQGEINARKAKIENIQAERQGQIAAQEATIKRLEAQLEGEKEAQKAIIEGLKAQLQNATTECGRYENLYQDNVIPAQQRDSKCLAKKVTQQNLQEAQVNLNRITISGREQISEAKVTLKRISDTLQQQQTEAKANFDQTAQVRPEDVAIAQAELKNAQAVVQQAQAELDTAYVRSPKTGQVLNIHTRPGEIINNKGVISLGQTQQMYATAEVYETDISKVRIGQRAKISSTALTDKLQGTVEEINLEIGKKDIFSNDPVADVDVRVVRVKIRLDLADSQKVMGLTNLKVKSIIDTSSGD